ncbi:MAG TPA: hypothetical protein VGK19_01805 [Capsulimonadaceae bacterium]|jgi:hypothetical protein
MDSIDVTGTNLAPQSPLCRELRSKKVLTMDTIPMSAADVRDASGHCWCRVTMQPVGPDGEFVHADDCVPGRSCYVSHFDPA